VARIPLLDTPDDDQLSPDLFVLPGGRVVADYPLDEFGPVGYVGPAINGGSFTGTIVHELHGTHPSLRWKVGRKDPERAYVERLFRKVSGTHTYRPCVVTAVFLPSRFASSPTTLSTLNNALGNLQAAEREVTRLVDLLNPEWRNLPRRERWYLESYCRLIHRDILAESVYHNMAFGEYVSRFVPSDNMLSELTFDDEVAWELVSSAYPLTWLQELKELVDDVHGLANMVDAIEPVL